LAHLRLLLFFLPGRTGKSSSLAPVFLSLAKIMGFSAKNMRIFQEKRG